MEKDSLISTQCHVNGMQSAIITEHLLAHSSGDTCDCSHFESPTYGAGQSEDGTSQADPKGRCLGLAILI